MPTNLKKTLMFDLVKHPLRLSTPILPLSKSKRTHFCTKIALNNCWKENHGSVGKQKRRGANTGKKYENDRKASLWRKSWPLSSQKFVTMLVLDPIPVIAGMNNNNEMPLRGLAHS